MEFRWTALMALWTMLAGPIFAGPPRPSGNSGTYPTVVKTRTVPPAGPAVKP
jgi:hypothetical protein